MFSGLINLKNELLVSAADATLSKERRELALTLLDDLSTSQLAGYMPEKPPTDGWLADEVLPLRTQIDVMVFVELTNRWWNDPNRPKPTWEFIAPTSQETTGSPVPVSETPDFEDGEYEDVF